VVTLHLHYGSLVIAHPLVSDSYVQLKGHVMDWRGVIVLHLKECAITEVTHGCRNLLVSLLRLRRRFNFVGHVAGCTYNEVPCTMGSLAQQHGSSAD
jgi:hypothetical protein